jgi:3-oxoacyl-[acyl-carrier-protein] synthase II
VAQPLFQKVHKLVTQRQRIVVTGLGALTPIGNDIPEIWQALLHGQSGITSITHFDTRETRRLDRAIQLALVAARQAVADAGNNVLPDDRSCLAVVIGTGVGCTGTIYREVRNYIESGSRAVSPFFVPMGLPDSIAARIAMEFDARGMNLTFPAACASGTIAIGEAVELIRRGSADVVIAGGAEAGIVPPVIAGFGQMRVLSTHNEDPACASRPFAGDRDGFVLSEGAAILVIEPYERAIKRGAKIYGEIGGYGASMDASSFSAPMEGGQEMARAMLQALHQSGLDSNEIGYLNAHGTGTRLNDRVETQAIKLVFDPDAGQLAISSTKSMMGHLLGAAGAIEALISLKVLEEGIIPPTINYQQPDPDCDLDYTPNHSRILNVNAAMSNSLGMGGHNACLVFRKI